MTINMTFQKAITLFQDEANYLLNTDFNEYRATNFRIFDLNTLEEMQKILPKVS